MYSECSSFKVISNIRILALSCTGNSFGLKQRSDVLLSRQKFFTGSGSGSDSTQLTLDEQGAVHKMTDADVELEEGGCEGRDGQRETENHLTAPDFHSALPNTKALHLNNICPSNAFLGELSALRLSLFTHGKHPESDKPAQSQTDAQNTHPDCKIQFVRSADDQYADGGTHSETHAHLLRGPSEVEEESDQLSTYRFKKQLTHTDWVV